MIHPVLAVTTRGPSPLPPEGAPITGTAGSDLAPADALLLATAPSRPCLDSFVLVLPLRADRDERDCDCGCTGVSAPDWLPSDAIPNIGGPSLFAFGISGGLDLAASAASSSAMRRGISTAWSWARSPLPRSGGFKTCNWISDSCCIGSAGGIAVAAVSCCC